MPFDTFSATMTFSRSQLETLEWALETARHVVIAGCQRETDLAKLRRELQPVIESAKPFDAAEGSN